MNNNIDILICSLDSRKNKFNFIFNKISNQINLLNFKNKINIKYYIDNKQASVGFKRNSLINRSVANYIAFVDDDDNVCDNYIKLLYEASLSGSDCASLHGEITFDGKNPKKFIHSLDYNSYFENNNIYYRPPNHLNLIKREIACQFKFPEKNCGEDTDWAMLLCNNKALNTEYKIDEIIYHYNFSSTETETQK